MNVAVSVFLDVVRFAAALVVFFCHVSGKRLTGGLLWQLESYGSEAVTVFFVLSGYVVAYVVSTREKSATEYAISRVARIYSVALPALVTTFVLDTLGYYISEGMYSGSWGYSPQGQLQQFVSGLFFVHKIWYLNIPQGSNFAYWSLGYEVWYYLISGLQCFPVVLGGSFS